MRADHQAQEKISGRKRRANGDEARVPPHSLTIDLPQPRPLSLSPLFTIAEYASSISSVLPTAPRNRREEEGLGAAARRPSSRLPHLDGQRQHGVDLEATAMTGAHGSARAPYFNQARS